MIHRIEETTSTNDDARDAKYRHGDIVWAERQTAGRGQRGHKWSSAEGLNLTFSLVLEPRFLPAGEQFLLNEAVALSGLPKQEYCYRRCMQRDIVVQPNPRVYKALKTTMEKILSELQRLSDAGGVTDEMRDTLALLSTTLSGMKGDDADGA